MALMDILLAHSGQSNWKNLKALTSVILTTQKVNLTHEGLHLISSWVKKLCERVAVAGVW